MGIILEKMHSDSQQTTYIFYKWITQAKPNVPFVKKQKDVHNKLKQYRDGQRWSKEKLINFPGRCFTIVLNSLKHLFIVLIEERVHRGVFFFKIYQVR